MTATKTADLTLQTEQEADSSSKTAWLYPLVIVAVGLIAYSNSLQGAFLFDDRDEILNNVHIRKLLPPWEAMFSPQNVGRPLVGLSLAVNYAIGGFEVVGYHLFNIGIHLLAGLALFGVVRRTLRSERLQETWSKRASFLALASALIWIAHPLCTQSVDYTIQRAESMMGLFYLLTLYCSIRSAGSDRKAVWYIAAATSCLAGMLSKQVMVTAPLIVLLWDYLFLGRSLGDLLRRRWPLYAGLSATWAALAATLIAMPRSQSAGFGIATFTPLQYLMTQCGVIVHYLRLSIWPNPLCFDYAWPKATSPGEILPGAIILAGLLGATVCGMARKSPLSFPGLWFFLILSVTSSFMPLDDAAFEYRMYLPLAAVVVLLVIGLGAALNRFVPAIALFKSRTAAGVAAVTIVVAIYGALTIRRNSDYRSELIMWTDVISKRPNNDRAHADLAFALAAMNRHEEALEHLEIACRLNPENAATQASLGLGLLLHGDAGRAQTHLAEAVRLRPNSALAHYNLARALLLSGDAEGAADHFKNAIDLNQDYSQARLGLGRSLERQGHFAEAIENYRDALKMNPDWPEALCQLAITLATCQDSKLRDTAEAVRLGKRAVSLTDAQNPGPLDILAAVYAEADRFADAESEAKRALELLDSSNAIGGQRQDLMNRLAQYEKQQKPRPPTSIAWR